MQNGPTEAVSRRHSPQVAHRRLNLSDILILVAALAIGGTWTRSYVLDVLRWVPNIGPSVWMRILYWIPSATPLLMCLSLAQLVLMMIRPRPRMRRVLRQPGTSACFAAVTALAISGSLALAAKMINPIMGLVGPPVGAGVTRGFMLTVVVRTVGLVVAGTWLNLALSRRWAAERSWIDWLGRGLGVGWIGISAAETLVIFTAFS